MSRRGLEAMIEDSSEEDFEDSGSEYLPSCSDANEDYMEENEKVDQEFENDANFDESESEVENDEENEERNAEKELMPTIQIPSSRDIWHENDCNFIPRFQPPDKNIPSVLVNLDRSHSELDCFLKIFPRSLLLHIADCTNKRLKLRENQTRKQIYPTDFSEIMIIIGVILVMSYNRLPAMCSYWSHKKSRGNVMIKEAISRDRFLLLASKLYFADPEKPESATKTYYIDDLIACLKYTFKKCREESTLQSIDESMVKFKGRSVLKQYMPMKPIKRGIKVWERCDSNTGYVYDFNIYCGKAESTETVEGTLGERVVKKLVSTVQRPDISFCFDRFFTSVDLLNTINFPAVGTCMSSRKKLPKFSYKMERGDSRVLTNGYGTTAITWKDTKQVICLSNCHKGTVDVVQRKNKKGEKTDITCPDAIKFYNQYMGGIDLSDQFVSLYDINRRSNKWWKKVYYKLLQTSCVNAFILYGEIQHKKIKYYDFLTELAEQLIEKGRQNATIKRKRSYGRPSSSSKKLICLVTICRNEEKVDVGVSGVTNKKRESQKIRGPILHANVVLFHYVLIALVHTIHKTIYQLNVIKFCDRNCSFFFLYHIIYSTIGTLYPKYTLIFNTDGIYSPKPFKEEGCMPH